MRSLWSVAGRVGRALALPGPHACLELVAPMALASEREPQGLKPLSFGAVFGTTEVVP